jgi:membrane protease YdiL (CAAX protease family)
VEEILFRGYLQRQIGALSGNIYVGLVVSAILFGAGHGYEGARRMVLIAVLGLMFGVLTLLRKSLRPGMMAHALFDSLQGAVLWAIRKGMIPLQ